MAFVHPLQKRTNVVEVLVVEAGIDGRADHQAAQFEFPLDRLPDGSLEIIVGPHEIPVGVAQDPTDDGLLPPRLIGPSLNRVRAEGGKSD